MSPTNRPSKPLAALIAALGLLLAGCAAPAVQPAAAPTAQLSTNPTAAPAAAPTATPTAAPPSMPSGPGAQWNLLVLGDSSLYGLGEAYARQIQRDLGVQVVLSDFAISNINVEQVTEVLETGKSANFRLEKLPDAARNADVIVMFLLPGPTGKRSGVEICFFAMPPGACSVESFAGYTADLTNVWAKLIQFRAGRPTILRATDIYSPLVDNWESAGVLEECAACWNNLSGAARSAADAHQIPFISRYDLFNGPSHDRDPRAIGFLAKGGEHPTSLASQETAKLLAKQGYLPDLPPTNGGP